MTATALLLKPILSPSDRQRPSAKRSVVKAVTYGLLLLKELEEKMRTAQVRRLPVVGFDGELVGIVTLGDIARSAHSSPLRLTELPGLARTLASITERR